MTSEYQLSAILDSSSYLTGIAVAGYNGASTDNDRESPNLNLRYSNSLAMINIDDRPGNMAGKFYQIVIQLLSRITCSMVAYKTTVDNKISLLELKQSKHTKSVFECGVENILSL